MHKAPAFSGKGLPNLFPAAINIGKTALEAGIKIGLHEFLKLIPEFNQSP